MLLHVNLTLMPHPLACIRFLSSELSDNINREGNINDIFNPNGFCFLLCHSTRCFTQHRVKRYIWSVEKKNQLDATEMVYCTYNMLNMFRALLCPSSGARDYMRVITMMCDTLVTGCWRSGAGQPAVPSE